jgi:hypothetical protein
MLLYLVSHISLAAMVLLGEPPRPAEELLNLLRRQERAIWSFDVTYKVDKAVFLGSATNDPAALSLRKEPSRSSLCITHAKQGQQERLEIRDSEGVLEQIRVATEPFGHERVLHMKQARGRIDFASLTPVLPGMDYRIPWRNAFGITPTSMLVEERKDLVQIVKGAESYKPTYRLPTAPRKSLDSLEFELTLDPARGGLVASQRVYQVIAAKAEACLLAEHQVTEWHQIADGAYVPLVIHSAAYLTTGTLRGSKVNSFCLTVDRARSTWNQPIDPARFTLEFPEGTRVADQIRKVAYTQGEAKPERRLDRLADMATDILKAERLGVQAANLPPLRSETLLAAAPWWQSTPAIIAYVVLALALVYFLFRRRRLAAE